MSDAMYLRKSRADDPAESVFETLQKHRRSLLECAQRLGLVITDVYEEVVSGESIYARPEMMKLLEAVEAGRHRSVLCMDIDRLGRGDMRDQGIILHAFKVTGTKIITPDKTYDLSDEADETMTELKTFISRQEYKQIKKRLRRGIERVVQDGGYPGNAPFGYTKTRMGKLATLSVNEDEAPFVRMIFDMYSQGIGADTIAKHINKLGAKPHRSDAFNRNSVRFVLKNPTYIGKVPWNRVTFYEVNGKRRSRINPPEQWLLVDGIHPPIITPEQFAECERIRTGRHVLAYYTGETRSPLAGLVKCGNCGHNMQMMPDRTHTPYLLCAYARDIMSTKLVHVESAILSYLNSQIGSLRIELQRGADVDVSALEAAKKNIQRELAKAQAQRDKLYDLLEQGVYDLDTFSSRMASLSERLAALQAQEDECSRAIATAAGQNRQAQLAQLEYVVQAYDSSTVQQKNWLLKSVIDQVVYHKERKTPPLDFQLEITPRVF